MCIKGGLMQDLPSLMGQVFYDDNPNYEPEFKDSIAVAKDKGLDVMEVMYDMLVQEVAFLSAIRWLSNL